MASPLLGRATRCILALVVCATALSAASRSAAQDVSDPVPPFDASASADGARLTLEVPGAPLTNKLVDVGAPTAQVAAASLGLSRGYAAFPDPGELIQSAPGLAAGLLLQGAAGLPPISLPTLPGYPLLAISDINGTRHAELGEGLYQLRANSVSDHSDASASGGLQTGVAGNVAAVKVTAEAGVQGDGSVLATATSDVQSLTIGPLTIGRVISTATVKLSDGGAVEPTSSISISALRIGGIDVAINEEGLLVGSVNVPIPIGDTLASLLAAAGLDIHLTTAQTFDNAVIAPTLVISTLVETGVGVAPGTLSLTLGGATAALTGPTATDPLPTPVDTATPVPSLDSGAALDSPSFGAEPPSFVPLPDQASAVPSISATPVSAERTGELVGLFDIKSTYLALAGCAAGLYALGQIIRLLGVRWISIAG